MRLAQPTRTIASATLLLGAAGCWRLTPEMPNLGLDVPDGFGVPVSGARDRRAP